MATLASGAFITSINGKRCTAVPKAGASSKASASLESTSTASTTSATPATTAKGGVAQFTAVLATAAPSQDESSTSTSTEISTSLILTTSTSITSAPPPPSPQVKASAQVTPAVLESSPSPEPVPATTSSIPTFTQIDSTQTQSQSQPAQTVTPTAIIQTGQTDTVDTAFSTQTTADPTADTTADDAASSLQQGTALPDVTASPSLPDTAVPLFTTIGTAPGSSNSPAAAGATGSSSSTNGAVSAVPGPNTSAIQSTVAVAGGVIGGVLLVSMVAFFGWWWRRRTMKRRRSTLLTPLTIGNGSNNNNDYPDEKGEYIINRGSIGPTPRVERLKSALGYNMRKINGSISRIVTRRGSRGSTAPSVNMNRGNSQFMESAADVNRPDSSTATGVGAKATTKERLMDWWGRLTSDINFSNWRLRSGKNPNSDDLFGSPRGMNERAAGGSNTNNPTGTTPDFLTLLGMEDRALDRDAQRRRMSPSRQAGGSASSSDRFLGGLNLSFSGAADDPFSDANAVNAHISAKPAPLVVSQTNNPFSDANAVVPAPSSVQQPKRGTYAADVRRSRGQSVGQTQRPPSSVVGGAGYRESGASVESFGTRRNKFRSDPFDLERPELLGRSNGGSMSSSAGATIGTAGSSRISGGVGVGDVRRPVGAHTRADSFTSKYSSGVSMGDWSDPGPDVGPAAARGAAWEGPEQRESPTQGWRTRMERKSVAKKERRTSGGSQGSVGKAM